MLQAASRTSADAAVQPTEPENSQKRLGEKFM